MPAVPTRGARGGLEPHQSPQTREPQRDSLSPPQGPAGTRPDRAQGTPRAVWDSLAPLARCWHRAALQERPLLPSQTLGRAHWGQNEPRAKAAAAGDRDLVARGGWSCHSPMVASAGSSDWDSCLRDRPEPCQGFPAPIPTAAGSKWLLRHRSWQQPWWPWGWAGLCWQLGIPSRGGGKGLPQGPPQHWGGQQPFLGCTGAAVGMPVPAGALSWCPHLGTEQLQAAPVGNVTSVLSCATAEEPPGDILGWQ